MDIMHYPYTKYTTYTKYIKYELEIWYIIKFNLILLENARLWTQLFWTVAPENTFQMILHINSDAQIGLVECQKRPFQIQRKKVGRYGDELSLFVSSRPVYVAKRPRSSLASVAACRRAIAWKPFHNPNMGKAPARDV